MPVIEYETKFHAMLRNTSMILPIESEKVCQMIDYFDLHVSLLGFRFRGSISESDSCCLGVKNDLA